MIYEKGLIKAMKDKYKAGGYSVADDGNGILWIVADMWFAGIQKEKVSNDVKSVIVLQNDDLIIQTATEDALLPMAYGYTTWLRNGYLVQDDGESFVGALSCHGFDDEAGKIALLEQVDWR